jgi:hypothetical protein
MEQWQVDALTKLLENAGTSVNVTDGRVYLQSDFYGETRFHMVSKNLDGDIIIDQTDHKEKYQQRVTFEAQEVGPLLRALLLWHLESVKLGQELQFDRAPDDSLGDLDSHSF